MRIMAGDNPPQGRPKSLPQIGALLQARYNQPPSAKAAGCSMSAPLRDRVIMSAPLWRRLCRS